MPARTDHARTPKRSIAICFGGFVLLALVVLTATMLTRHQRSNSRFEDQLNAIRQLDEPTTAADVEALYALPADVEDTTKLWQQATATIGGQAFRAMTERLPLVGDGETPLPLPHEPWADLEVIQRVLASQQKQIAALHAAARRQGAARYPTNFANGGMMLISHVQGLRDAARLLALDAHLKAREADAGGVAEDLNAIIGIGDSLRLEPVAISQYVRVACYETAIDQLLLLLPHVEFTPRQLTDLESALARIDFRESMRNSLLAERVIGLMTIDNPKLLWQDQPRFAWMTNDLDREFFLREMAASLKTFALPLPEALSIVEQDSQRREAELERIGRERMPVSGYLEPMLTRFIHTMARAQAGRIGAMASIGVERFRRRQGRLPRTLSEIPAELIREPLTDPTDGLLLKYRIDAGDAVIYSAGEDRVDHGGDGGLDYLYRVPYGSAQEK